MVATTPLVGLRDALTQPFGQVFLGPELASHMTPDVDKQLLCTSDKGCAIEVKMPRARTTHTRCNFALNLGERDRNY